MSPQGSSVPSAGNLPSEQAGIKRAVEKVLANAIASSQAVGAAILAVEAS